MQTADFNPRTPYGVRLGTLGDIVFTVSQFQSTHPIRSATQQAQAYLEAQQFQSTHPIRSATFTLCFPVFLS